MLPKQKLRNDNRLAHFDWDHIGILKSADLENLFLCQTSYTRENQAKHRIVGPYSLQAQTDSRLERGLGFKVLGLNWGF